MKVSRKMSYIFLILKTSHCIFMMIMDNKIVLFIDRLKFFENPKNEKYFGKK